jgi:hypothetical protein
MAYLDALDDEGAKAAFEYIRKAPRSIQTPLREAYMHRLNTE